jgi:LysM repeat protein
MTPIPTPDKVLGTYFTLWGGGMRITSVPASYNWIYLFHATPASGGAFQFEYGGAVSAADIKTCRDRGQRCVLTCGGANAGFNFQNRTQSQAFVNSFVQIVNSLGGEIDGCDFNNFEANIGSNPTEMVWISQQLKAKYGQNFSITCPPAPGAGYAPMDRTLTKAMADAGVLTFAGPQFYDSSDLTTESILMQLIPEWVKNVGGAEKVVIGAGSGYRGGARTDVTVSAWKKLVATYPNLRGIFGWSAQDDSGSGWAFGKAVAPVIGAKPATGGGTVPQPPVEPPVEPPVDPPQPPTPPSGSKTYTVVAGDTLNIISGKTGVSVADLDKWNDIIVDINTLEVGWVLRLTDPATDQPEAPSFAVGDKVKVLRGTYKGMTGTIQSISGTKANVTFRRNTRGVPLSYLQKI